MGQPGVIERMRSFSADFSGLIQGSRGIIAVFILLSALNAITEGMSIMIVVPILTALSNDGVFRNVPLLGPLASYFQTLTPVVQLQTIAAFVLFIAIARGVLQYFLDIATYLMPVKVEHNLKSRAFTAFLRTSVRFSDSMSSGEISNYLASYPARSGIAVRFFATMISSTISIILILSILVALTPQIIFVVGTFGLLSSLIFKRLTGLRAKIATDRLADSQQSFNQTYFEALHYHRNVSAQRLYGFFERRIQTALDGIHRQQVDLFKIQEATFPFFQTFAGVMVATVIVFAAWARPESVPQTIGLLVVSLVAMTRILGPLSLLHIARMHFINNIVAVTEMSEFFRRAERSFEQDGDIELGKGPHRIRLDDVRFSYDGARDVLEGISFEVKPGTMVAIMGPSGSGKSTVLNLIMRLYLPSQGSVLIDNIDVQNLKIASWADKFGYAAQDFAIFRGTIAQNISFSDQSEPATPAVEKAAGKAAVTTFATDMAGGLNASVREFGSNLSGGQQQRIMLARAFYRSKGVLLLDEPTSQLDAPTEAELRKTLETLRAEGYTIVVATHSAAVARSADHIVILNEGRVVQAGSHDALAGVDGYYRQLTGG